MAARVVMLALSAALFAAEPQLASAHGDLALVDGSFELEPGESIAYEGEVHYHRVVGHVSADRPVRVRVVRDGVVVLAREGSAIALNDLIRCCDDRGWTPHTLVLENDGPSPTRGQARVSLFHDDLAVMVYGAESGTRESLVILGAIWSAVLWRALRRPHSTTAMRTVIPLALVATVIPVLALNGAARYGVGAVPGFLGAAADLAPVPRNPIVSGVTLLVAITIVGWAFAARRWALADSVLPRSVWIGTGLALVCSVAVVGWQIAVTYGSPGVPIASWVAAAAPVLVVMAWRMWRPRLGAA